MNVYYFGRMEKILVSACLLGDKTRYDGKDNAVEGLLGLLKFYELVPFCPEVEGGLKTPRRPAEIHYGRVFRDDGVELTRQYDLGAKKALSLCKFLGIGKAILKESSPSCGVHLIHNGRFDGGKIEGEGVTARTLREAGIKVMNEDEGLKLLDSLLAKQAKREIEEAKMAKPEPKKPAKPKFKTTKNHEKGNWKKR